jgi:type II secretory pathway predicted ATPase ExeA
MYESFYGFNRRPFSAVPDLSTFFSSRNEEQIRSTLSRVLRRAEGPAVIFGGTGFGKTTTALRLAQDIAKDFQVAVLYCKAFWPNSNFRTASKAKANYGSVCMIICNPKLVPQHPHWC